MIAITAIGVRTIKRRVEKCQQRIARQRAMYAKGAVVVDRWIQKNFQSEGRSVGGWKPLSESTIARRRKGKKKSKGHRILQDTGQLRSRWGHTWFKNGFRVYSKVPYGVYHDSDKPRKRLPRRQILPDEKHIIKDLKKIVGDHVALSIEREDLND